MISRLKGTFQDGWPDKWANGQMGYMRYNETTICYQFASSTFYNGYDEINISDFDKFPIVVEGITAFVLRQLGRQPELIFDKYYNICLDKYKKMERYKQIEEINPDFSKRNLDAEFYSNHISEEKERIKFSQKINEYISDNEFEKINKYRLAYLTYIEHFNSPNSVTGNIQPKTDKKLMPTKTFPEYLMYDKRELLAEKLKTEFNTERGKGIRLLIESLQANEPQLLSTGNRQATAIYQSLKLFFNRDIGSYQSIFDYDYDIKNDAIDFKAVKLKLDFILNQINNTK